MKQTNFNMIEVLLALGVVAIGVVSVLALFPVGLASTRDAMAETYAATAAEQLLHSIRYTIDESDTNWTDWVINPNDDGDVWAAVPPPTDLVLENGTGSGAFAGSTLGAVHEQKEHHVYKLVAFRDANNDGAFDGPPDETPDFQCVAAVWGEQVGTVPLTFATRVNVEVSWPGELPYPSRFKRVYSLEVFNAKN